MTLTRGTPPCTPHTEVSPPPGVKKTNTIVRTFRGATVTKLEENIGFIEKEKPARVLVHVGTNDVERKSACEIIQDFENLAKTIHSISPASKIIFTGIVKRKQRNKDNITINSQVVDVNNDLKTLCTREGYNFIDNNNNDFSYLHYDRLHFKMKGEAVLARNIRI